MKIGIFGGTFNPIHYGHLRSAEEVKEKLSLDKVLFIPSGNPPLKTQDIADSAFRFEMVNMAITGNPRFEVLDIESRDTAKSYTVKTLEALSRDYSGSDLFFIVGTDAFLDMPNWYEPEKIISLVNFAVISRPGFNLRALIASPYIEIPENLSADLDSGKTEIGPVQLKSGRMAFVLRVTDLEISSADIRKRIKQGLSVKYLLPEKVESFIISQKMYNKKSRNNG